MAEQSEEFEVRVPDLGDVGEVDVVEIFVGPGDVVAVDDSLIGLETDKATMDVPAPRAGKVTDVAVTTGQTVKSGDLVLTLKVEVEGATEEASSGPAAAAGSAETNEAEKAESAPTSVVQPVADAGQVPDLEGFDDADYRAQVVVLGSGPGGYTAAFRAADLGLDVILVERFPNLGGVCLNVGCIPSKALLHAAEVVEEVSAMAEHGIHFGEPTVDVDRLRSWKQGVVDRLTGGLVGLAKRRKVRVLKGAGELVGAHRMSIQTEEGVKSVAFEQCILAVGSRVVKIGGMPWEDPRVMDSTDALELADIPQRLLVVGGGIIGLEMASVYNALGSRVTVVELMDRLIPGADKDLVRPLEKRIRSRYEAIHLSTKVSRVEAEDGGLRAFFQADGAGEGVPESDLYDRVLVAVGRRPNGDQIGAAAAGVNVDERGFIAVDREQRTNISHIFAIGDLTGQPMLAHKATHEGKVAAEVAAGEKSAFDARVIPSVAYTDPEVAWVGLTEEKAKAEGVAYEKGAFPWAASGRSLALGRNEGSTKLLFDPETHRVLGAGIVGPNAGELVAEAALAIEMGAEASDIALTIHPHPTLSETLAFAAEAYEGTLTDLYLPKRAKKKRS